MTPEGTRNLVFLHIPKTAGQTVHMELEQKLGAQTVSPIRLHTQVKHEADQYPAGYRLYSGHLDWRDLSVVPEPRFVFTVLRDPLERLASFYFFLQRQAYDASAALLASGRGKAMREILARTPSDFFLGGGRNWNTWVRDHFDNFQTNYLATGQVRGRRRLADMAPDTLIDLALKNSQKIDAIYTTQTLSRLEKNLTPDLGERPVFQSRRANAAPSMNEELRWPQLAALLGSDADHVATFGQTDQKLIERLGLSDAI